MMRYTETGANTFSGSTAVKNDTIQIISCETRVATSLFINIFTDGSNCLQYVLQVQLRMHIDCTLVCRRPKFLLRFSKQFTKDYY